MGTGLRLLHDALETDPNPAGRGKLGCKRRVEPDGRGVPLAVVASGANEHDSAMIGPLTQTLPAIAGPPGQPSTWPDKLHVDNVYDYAKCRASLRHLNIQTRIARRGFESSERLGRHRWIVDHTLARFKDFRKLRIRVKRRVKTHMTLLKLAYSIICAQAI